MKSAILFSVIFILGGPRACSSQPPEVCQLLTGFPKNSATIKELPFSELLELQKCGLEYHPHYLFGAMIAAKSGDPFPDIIIAFHKYDDDEYRLELIEIIIQVASASNHSQDFSRHREELLSEADHSINRMEDSELRSIATDRYRRLITMK
jgi:hypothetical protein